ncbi:MAG TPA: hypothetical protein VMU86_01265, partial [Steroidobacteraceae bacterium]|nr:hypothetical protein [Steroidobacteraceae bacterium]
MAALAAHAWAGAAPVPAAAFGAPQVSDVALSPDGRLLAWQDQSGSAANVVIFNLATKAYLRTLRVDPAMTLRGLVWADDDTLLMTLSDVQRFPFEAGPGRRSFVYYRTLAVNADTGKSRVLLMNGGARAWVTGANLLAWHTAEPHTVIMATLDYASLAHRSDIGTRIVDRRADSGWVRELFQVDTRTGKGKRIEEGDQFVEQWVVNAQGAAVARSEWRPDQHLYTIEAKDGHDWNRILARSDDQMTLFGLSADGKAIIATAPDTDGHGRLWSVPLDGSVAKNLIPGASGDVEYVIQDPFSGAPVGVSIGALDPTTRWFDDAAHMRYESIARAFPGRDVTLSSRSQDGSRVVAKVEGPSYPPIYYLV